MGLNTYILRVRPTFLLHTLFCTMIEISGPRRGQCHRYNQQCEKNEMVLGRAHQAHQRRSMDLTSHHLETTRENDDKGDTPSGAEKT